MLAILTASILIKDGVCFTLKFRLCGCLNSISVLSINFDDIILLNKTLKGTSLFCCRCGSHSNYMIVQIDGKIALQVFVLVRLGLQPLE